MPVRLLIQAREILDAGGKPQDISRNWACWVL